MLKWKVGETFMTLWQLKDNRSVHGYTSDAELAWVTFHQPLKLHQSSSTPSRWLSRRLKMLLLDTASKTNATIIARNWSIHASRFNFTVAQLSSVRPSVATPPVQSTPLQHSTSVNQRSRRPPGCWETSVIEDRSKSLGPGTGSRPRPSGRAVLSRSAFDHTSPALDARRTDGFY